jgi:putative ABC transport system substrate-binding protein
MPLVAVELAIAQDDSDGVRIARAFQQTLQESGWTPGQNIRIEYRWGATSAERAQVYAEELLKLNPDVIVAHATIVARAVSQQTNKIPTVFTNVSDPLGERFVKSFAQPGGEMTGFTNIEPSMGAKYLQLLKEIAPGVTRAAMLFNPQIDAWKRHVFFGTVRGCWSTAFDKDAKSGSSGYCWHRAIHFDARKQRWRRSYRCRRTIH